MTCTSSIMACAQAMQASDAEDCALYCSVARTVDPKRKKVAESEKNLRLAQKELARIKVSNYCCLIKLQIYNNGTIALCHVAVAC